MEASILSGMDTAMIYGIALGLTEFGHPSVMRWKLEVDGRIHWRCLSDEKMGEDWDSSLLLPI